MHIAIAYYTGEGVCKTQVSKSSKDNGNNKLKMSEIALFVDLSKKKNRSNTFIYVYRLLYFFPNSEANTKSQGWMGKKKSERGQTVHGFGTSTTAT